MRGNRLVPVAAVGMVRRVGLPGARLSRQPSKEATSPWPGVRLAAECGELRVLIDHRGYSPTMSERRRRYDPDERFPLDADPDDVLQGLFGAADPPPDEDEPAEGEAEDRSDQPHRRNPSSRRAQGGGTSTGLSTHALAAQRSKGKARCVKEIGGAHKIHRSRVLRE